MIPHGLFNRAMIVLAVAGPLSAQPPRTPPPEHIPPEVILETIRAAYDRKPTADEVKVSMKSGERVLATDSFTVRIDPGQGPTPARILLELDALKICITGQDLVAISAAAPGRYFQTRLSGPPTPQTLAKVLPPIPAPEMAFACSDQAIQRDLTPYTPQVNFTGATIGGGVRPSTATLQGLSSAGPVTLVANPASGRLLGLTATLTLHEGERTLELIVTGTEPGNPANWAIPVEGRERVQSLGDLRPAGGPAQPVAAGQSVPDLVFSRADFSGTNLHRLLAAAPSPAALILYRATPIERLEAASRDARAAGAVVRAAQLGQVSPGEAAATPIDLRLIPAMVMELGQYSRERLEQEQKQWGGGATRGAEALPATTPELLWANSASQTLDRFDPKAGAVLVLIGPDKKVIRVIPVDGRASDPAALAAELRAALGALGRP